MNKKKKSYPVVTLYVSSSSNNTQLVATDNGNVVAWSSAGAAGFKGAKKSTPHAASEATNLFVEKLRDLGVKKASIILKGICPGRDSAIKALGSSGIEITAIGDRTGFAFNGVRMKGRRRN